jgi:hypothetical protein
MFFTVFVVVCGLSLMIGFVGSILMARDNARIKREETELRVRQLQELRKTQR